MRPSLELDVQHRGNLGGERHSFSVDVSNNAALAHVMSILTDLYSDPVDATIREPSTNALDSHAKAGQTRPIEVHLPNDMNPSLRIRDFGVGLDREELLENYTRYGWSNKRETDDEAGMLGLGCKAPLTYTSQFGVTAIKNGRKCSVLVSRGADGVGGLEIIEEEPTTEPTGVEVIIPVNSDMHVMISKAKYFFGFWDEGLVLLDGQPPERHAERGGSVTIDPDIVRTFYLRRDYIVMGNVPYPISEPLVSNASYKYIVRVPMGSVNFTPSREELHYTPLTNDTIQEIKSFIREYERRICQRKIDECETPGEALKVVREWFVNRRLSVSKVTYRGKDIPRYLSLEGWKYFTHWDSAQMLDDHSLHLWRNADLNNSCFMVGYENKTFNRVHKDKLAKYLKDNKLTHSIVYAVPKLPSKFWLQGVPTIQWDDVRQVQLRVSDGKDKSPSKKRETTYETFVPSKSGNDSHARKWMTSDDLTGKLVVVSGTDTQDNARRVCLALPSDTIVIVKTQSFDKFMKEHPGAIDHTDALRIAARRAFYRNGCVLPSANHHKGRLVGRLLLRISSLEDILDKRLRNLVKVANSPLSKPEEDLVIQYLPRKDRDCAIDRQKKLEIKEDAYIKETYPLLENLYYAYSVKSEDVLRYVNAIYAYNTCKAQLTRQEIK